MVPNGVSGEVVEIKAGSFNVLETVAVVKLADGSARN
jgi:vacuolar-type H+-ATPase catalytic subunit A/Vma1